jgi:Aminoglycoside-2''-adenylyltransferase
VNAIEPDVSKWDPWRPDEAARLLGGVDAPWYVAGGWAIDLFLGGQQREHEDLEVAVPSSRFDEIVEALSSYELFVITGPRAALPLADAGDRLEQTHQTWVREPTGGSWRLDVFREPSDGDTWICRRNPSITMPYERLVERTADGLPYGRPEVILLFKAKHSQQPKNQTDFEVALPRLERERLRWLREALELVHPEHAWLSSIEGGER